MDNCQLTIATGWIIKMALSPQLNPLKSSINLFYARFFNTFIYSPKYYITTTKVKIKTVKIEL